mmetsp:Transcript_840/g.1414  ORF Transcript_840/g.1414 Transcript_840/m.1414 type:complete len:1307 (+) Transcript_840:70-3990(+)
MSTSTLNVLLEKTSHYDKDERYMATSDLCGLLATDIKIDDMTERQICAAVLKQLDDKSNDVQSVAVKCLGTLLKKVQQNQVGEICAKLCSLVLQGQNELRDIYSIGLKTLISDVPDAMGELVVSKLTSNLTNGIGSSNDDVKRECLDDMTDLLRRFGHLMRREHESILAVIVVCLEHSKSVIRKRASVCLGALAVVATDPLLFRLVDDLLRRIKELNKQKFPSSDDLRTLIQTIGTVSRTVGYRLGKSLDDLVPLFLRCCGDIEGVDGYTEAANDLREHCFPGLESFVLRCPKEIAPHVHNVLSKSLEFMTFDPNYCYDSDEEVRDVEEEGEFDEDDYEDDDYEGSDDDDTSWKVRKAAIRVVSAIISARAEILEPDVYVKVADDLVSRFKEREESVRLEIFACFTSLLQATLSRAPVGGVEFVPTPSLSTHRSRTSGTIPVTRTRSASGDAISPSKEREINSDISNFLLSKASIVINLCKKQLNGSSLKSKSAVFHLLGVFVRVLKGSMEEHIKSLLRDVVKMLATERNENVKYDALVFLHIVFNRHDAGAMQPFVTSVLPIVVNAVQDDWYKVTSAALRVIGDIITTCRPSSADIEFAKMEVSEPTQIDSSAHVEAIYSAVLPRLEAPDIDHEIKEEAIHCAGQLLSRLGDCLAPSERAILMGHLHKRLDNEVTRIPALKALSFVAMSELQLDVAPMLSRIAADVATFLRQQSRILKQTSLQALDAIMKSSASQSGAIPSETICSVLHEVSLLINDSDLSITDLSLKVTCGVLNLYHEDSTTATTMCEVILPRVISLASSPLMQGAAQNSLIALLQSFVSSGVPNLSFRSLRERLLSRLTVASDTSCNGQQRDSQLSVLLPKQSINILAQCLAGICLSAPADVQQDAVSGLLSDLWRGDEARKHLALLCIGHLGQKIDLSAAGGTDNLKEQILDCFETGSEDIKAATAFALGHLAVGSMDTFLPIILQAIDSNKHQYLLLAALKETIIVHVQNGLNFSPYLDSVLPGMQSLAVSEEEGVRNMVAECFGALAVMHPDTVLPLLHQYIEADGENKTVLWTVATSMRYYFTRYNGADFTSPLVVQPFLALLGDDDIEVCRASTHMVNAAVHYNPALVADSLEKDVVPHILKTLSLKRERVVDLGPFKHKVDDALPLRKAALTCCETILFVKPDAMDATSLASQITSMLTDNKDDTNLQCHQVLCKLCGCHPGAVLCVVDDLERALERAIEKNIPKDTGTSAAAGPEAERSMEQIRSCVRLVATINSLEDISQKRSWQDFIEKLRKRALVSDIMSQMRGHDMLRDMGF